MTYKITLSKKADETFDLMRSQIFSRWGKRHVLNFEERNLKILEIITKDPFIFQLMEMNPNIRKAHIHLQDFRFRNFYFSFLGQSPGFDVQITKATLAAAFGKVKSKQN